MTQNKNQVVFLSLVLGLPILLLSGYFLMVSTIFNNATPTANLKITISSKDVDVTRVVSVIERLKPALSTVVNKHDDTRYQHKFMFYKHALWFPQNDSKYYGISLIEWDLTRWEGSVNDEKDNKEVFIISVFSKDNDCAYCTKLTEKLEQLGIAYDIDSSR